MQKNCLHVIPPCKLFGNTIKLKTVFGNIIKYILDTFKT